MFKKWLLKLRRLVLLSVKVGLFSLSLALAQNADLEGLGFGLLGGARLRYRMFALSLGLVLLLWFGLGYRARGVGLVVAPRDNRAFSNTSTPTQ